MTTDILTRLREAEGPDRELDRDIGLAIGGWRYEALGDLGEMLFVPEDATYYGDSPGAMYPSFTESIEASLALVERMLPGCAWEITTTGFKPGASIVVHGPRTMFGAYANTPALALIAALFTALQEKENTNADH